MMHWAPYHYPPGPVPAYPPQARQQPPHPDPAAGMPPAGSAWPLGKSLHALGLPLLNPADPRSVYTATKAIKFHTSAAESHRQSAETMRAALAVIGIDTPEPPAQQPARAASPAGADAPSAPPEAGSRSRASQLKSKLHEKHERAQSLALDLPHFLGIGLKKLSGGQLEGLASVLEAIQVDVAAAQAVVAAKAGAEKAGSKPARPRPGAAWARRGGAAPGAAAAAAAPRGTASEAPAGGEAVRERLAAAPMATLGQVADASAAQAEAEAEADAEARADEGAGAARASQPAAVAAAPAPSAAAPAPGAAPNDGPAGTEGVPGSQQAAPPAGQATAPAPAPRGQRPLSRRRQERRFNAPTGSVPAAAVLWGDE